MAALHIVSDGGGPELPGGPLLWVVHPSYGVRSRSTIGILSQYTFNLKPSTWAFTRRCDRRSTASWVDILGRWVGSSISRGGGGLESGYGEGHVAVSSCRQVEMRDMPFWGPAE